MKKSNLTECADFFKGKKEFQRLFSGFLDNYRRMGRVAGSVFLSLLTADEKEVFSDFFYRDFHKQTNASISALRFERAIQNNGFEDIDLKELLEEYYGELPQTKDEEKAKRVKKADLFWGEILEKYRGTTSGDWLAYIMESKDNAYPFIMKKYTDQQEELIDVLLKTMDAGNALPVDLGRTERLFAFSQRVTGNPDYFNEGTLANRMLGYFIRHYLKKVNKDTVIVDKFDLETRNELFYNVGILREDLMNFTTGYGFRAVKSDGSYHKGLDGYFEEKQPIQISLLTLLEISAVEAEDKNVYVLETQETFSRLAEEITGATMMCINGQLNVASLILLDLLYQGGFQLHYSGNFTPESLLLAQRLKQRYGEKITLWRYSPEDYEKSITDEKLTPKRLDRLESLLDSKLISSGEIIFREKRVGSQLLLLTDYISDIKKQKK